MSNSNNNHQQTIITAEGYHLDTPDHIHYVNISLGSWDGVEGHADNDIFYYTDGEPINVGDTLSDSFVVTAICLDENLEVDLDDGLSAINE